ncbi:endonuclease/exonuclease/phosphatase family protein [Maribacter polysaccharolyticus]|uniref:endonuclease/exonuclease/phosphatase family protein n=1 Tax=Maribacter polysaccharolyticus TaxID=3020831 RepID=UPI00237F17C8|nr:endonuclease/exonuclease/phosphatase family protein [Maribacter polysaccharolyticus]MDE3740802.1 endonuclease/exonuclease/phosphatase family protein [Maribacter polysaccharolyticus]
MFKSNLGIPILFFLLVQGLQSQEIKVMTYNIKYDHTIDTLNNWNDRKESMVKLIRYYNPVIVGMQEVLHRQISYLDSSLTDYSYVGVGRDDGQQKGEYSPIFYNHRKLKVLESHTFWLSPTPDRISKGWDAALERICTYALFENREDHHKFYVFNTHFDHRGAKARKNSVALILEKIKEINDGVHPLVLTGDFNLGPEEAPIQHLKKYLDEGMDHTQKPFYGPRGTFTGFDPNKMVNHKIDYIFVKGYKVQSYTHIDDRMENNKYISDHLPVLATLEN